MEKTKIEKIFNKLNDIREISIDYSEWSFLTIYGRHINGWFLCMPGWNISCELANPAQGSQWNQEHLAKAFEESGWSEEISADAAREILKVIYDYENFGIEL